MAKKTKFELDSFEFDRSLDMPDFDFEVKIPKNDGKPITKIGKAAGRGFPSRQHCRGVMAAHLNSRTSRRGLSKIYTIAEPKNSSRSSTS
jgi:hypothetical protein